MTGQWEQGLRNLAEGGQPWDVPARRDLIARLQQLAFVLNKVVSEPGLTGESGTAATETFALISKDIAAQVTYLQDDLQTALKDANAQRALAGERLASLGSGRLSAGQEAAVRAAAVGTTLVLGPLSVAAGEGAVQLLNNFLGDKREEEAEQYYTEVSEAITAVKIAMPPPLRAAEVYDPDPVEPVGGTPIPVGGGGGGGGGRGPGGGGPSRPGVQTGVIVGEPGSYGFAPVPGAPPGGGTPPGGGAPPVYEPPHPAPQPPGPPIDIGKIPDDYVPTPDGPTGGVGTLPGGGGGTGATLPGGGASGMGPGLGVGMAVGAGGAAAIGRVGLPGGGAMPGGHSGGLSGGLLGRGASAGAPAGGLGVRSGAGIAGGGMGGVGAQAGARGGSAGTAAGGAGAAGGGRGGVGAGVGGGMGGGGGARGDRKDSPGRGLGGPIAEHLEDDEEFGPRSENAGAGGRE